MNKKSGKRLIGYSCFSLFFSLFIFAGLFFTFYHFYDNSFAAVMEDSQRENIENISEFHLTVPEDMTIQSLSSLLFEKGFIGNPLLFNLHHMMKGNAPLIPGDYTLTNTMDNVTILDLLTSEQVDQVASIRLTIPEGFTINQMADRVDSLGITSREAFLKAANERTYNYSFLEHIPTDTAYPLEGYLFPDTYFVSPNSSGEEIIIMMLNRFEDIVSKYTTHLYNSPYSLHDVLTIASIIEDEAKLSEERPIISGVIYNRLDTGMKLQMCSTVQYALDQRKTILTLEDLTVDSPYNTYLYEGLPIAPICAPGEDALKAAFLPETHDYFFFVLNNESVGSHNFSKTAEQHAAYKAQYNLTSDQNFIN